MTTPTLFFFLQKRKREIAIKKKRKKNTHTNEMHIYEENNFIDVQKILKAIPIDFHI